MAKVTDKDYISCVILGRVPDDIAEKNPTLHFCPEWDEMLIEEDTPEFESCNCEEFQS